MMISNGTEEYLVAIIIKRNTMLGIMFPVSKKEK